MLGITVAKSAMGTNQQGADRAPRTRSPPSDKLTGDCAPKDECPDNGS